MTQSHYTHPLTILNNLWRVVYLIIIPVVRGFIGAIQGDFTAWVQGAWIDITILFSMIILAVWRWLRVTYSWSKEGVHVASGIINRRVTSIPWENIVTLSVVRPWILRPVQAVRLRADTLGGSFKDADVTLLLSPRQADELFTYRAREGSAAARSYSPGTSSILALSLLSSNSFAGIVFLATFITQTGRLLGNEFSDMLLGTVEETARNLEFLIPPAAAVLTFVLLAGWLAAFILSFLRYKNMHVSRHRDTLLLTGGLFTRRQYQIKADDINFFDIRQNLFTKMLKLYSLYISAVGYGKQKNDISCIVPTESQETFYACCSRLFPGHKPGTNRFRPGAHSILRFLSQPLAPCVAIPIATVALCWLFPGWKNFVIFVGFMLLVPSSVFLLVRLVDYFTGGMNYDGKTYTLRYSSGFSLHVVLIPAHKVSKIELRQNPMQQMRGNCDLRIYTESERRSVHVLRSLQLREMQKLFSLDITSGWKPARKGDRHDK